MALNRRPQVQSNIADVIKTSFFSFFLGPIRPRPVGQGGAQGAVGERVKLFNYHFTSPHFPQDPFTGSHIPEILSQAQSFQESFHKPTFSTRPFHRLTPSRSPFISSSFSVIISQAHIFHKTLSQAHTFQKSFHKLKLFCTVKSSNFVRGP